MRFAIVDPEAVGLSWARRLYDEGCDVQYYVHPTFQRDVGTNIVPKMNSLHQLFAWAKQEKTIAFFTSSGMGKRKHGVPLGADDFRKAGVATIGGGSFCDRLETDRKFGSAIAEVIGCKIPPTKEFSSISQAIQFCSTVAEDSYYFKSDKYLESDATFGGTGAQLVKYLESIREKYGDNIPNILQEKIKGVALSTACWYNGRSFVPPYEGTIEHKKFMNDDVGPSTGCCFNAVWFYGEESPKVVKSLQWNKLDGIFNRYSAPAGLYDINAIISEKDGEAYFLEWTPRCGWDSEATSHRLLTTDLCEFLERLSGGRLSEVPMTTKEIAYSARLSVSPYPWEHNENAKKTCEGTPINGVDGLWNGHFIPYSVAQTDKGEFYVADRNGLVGLTLATGKSLKGCHDEAMAYVKDELEVPSVQYRTDGAKVILKDSEGLKALGYELPGALFK